MISFYRSSDHLPLVALMDPEAPIFDRLSAFGQPVC
jgi:hypothetical protein